MFQLQLFFLLHCDEWDRVVALPRHKVVTGATLLQLVSNVLDVIEGWGFYCRQRFDADEKPYMLSY
jgi:hypothetical protein